MYTVCSCPCARMKYLKEEMFSVIFQESLNKFYQHEWLKFELLKTNLFLLWFKFCSTSVKELKPQPNATVTEGCIGESPYGTGLPELLLNRLLWQSTHSAFVSCCGLRKAVFPSRSTEKVGSPCSCCFSGGLEQTEYWQAEKSIWGGPIPELNRPKLMHGFPLFQGKNYFQAKYCLKLHMTFTFASPEVIGKTIASNVFTKMRDLG